MRADSAVEPTKSKNIAVTWRRSAASGGFGSTIPLPVSVFEEDVPCSPRSLHSLLWLKVLHPLQMNTRHEFVIGLQLCIEIRL
jgi:hypothetical protein